MDEEDEIKAAELQTKQGDISGGVGLVTNNQKLSKTLLPPNLAI